MNTTNTAYFENRLKAREDEAIFNRNQMPFRYVFILTNACNLRCSFCFQEKKPMKGSLNLDDWKYISSQLPFGSHITLTGGEPLLFRGFQELVTSLRKDISFNIITNGLLLNKQISDFLVNQEGLRVLSCSIDDVGNSSRDFSKEMWQNLVSNLSYFRDKKNHINPDIVLDIKTVVHGGNIEGMSEMSHFTSTELNSDTHMFMFLKGSPMQHSDVMFDYDFAFTENKGIENYNIPEVLNQIKKLRKSISNNLVGNTKFFLHPKYIDLYSDQSLDIIEELLDKPYHNPDNYLSCRSPWESVHINNSGDVFPCLSFSIGNTRDKSIKDIINSENMRKFKSDLEKCGTLPGCKQCGYLRPKDTKFSI